MYVQQPVMVGGYGTLEMGYMIPACPWNPWQNPVYGYQDPICYGYIGGQYPYYFGFWRNGRWIRNYYGARQFGVYFGRSNTTNNIANRNYVDHNAASGHNGTVGGQRRNGWNHFNGRQGSKPNQNNRPNQQVQQRGAQNPERRTLHYRDLACRGRTTCPTC